MSLKRLKQLIAVFWILALVLFGVMLLTGSFSALSRSSSLSAILPGTAAPVQPSPTPFQPAADASPTPSLIPPTPTDRPRPTLGPDGLVLEPLTIFPTSTPPDSLAKAFFPVALPGVNPLTGLAPASVELLDRRPIAVKVTLFPRYMRKWQSGVSRADVVYEYYIEDGLSRFVAVMYGNDATRIGPVRSGRYFDEHIMRMYHSYLIYANADERVKSHFYASDLKDFFIVPGSSNCPPLCRDKNIEDYNNVFLNTTTFSDYLQRAGRDDTKPMLRANFLSESPTTSAQDGERVHVTYSEYNYHYWQYDEDSHKYFRFQETNDLRNGQAENVAPLVDVLTGEQISASNVIVIFVPHRFMNEYEKEDQVFHVDLLGSGRAYLFRDGTVTTANWWRLYVEQSIVLTDPSGNPLPIKPGNIFYIVLGAASKQYNLEGEWHFDWVIP